MGRAGWTDDLLQTMPQKACRLPNAMHTNSCNRMKNKYGAECFGVFCLFFFFWQLHHLTECTVRKSSGRELAHFVNVNEEVASN